MTDLERLRRGLLEARETRSALIARLVSRPPSGRPQGALIFVSANVPGPDKRAAAVSPVVNRTVLAMLQAIPGACLVRRGVDALGPYAALLVDASPTSTKLSTLHLEEELPWGRLIDADVYDESGHQVDRGLLGMPPRPCFICEQPAHECMRLERHPAIALQRAVARLISLATTGLDAPAWPWPAAPVLDGRVVARAIAAGARAELDLTPKPGLVDAHDNGSHPDLSYERMRQSIDLLPRYFDELVEIAERPADEGDDESDAAWPRFDLERCREAGRNAEARMLREVGSNTHRGLIFLGGLSVLAACPPGPVDVLEFRARVALLAGLLLGGSSEDPGTHGAQARQRHGIGGIHTEARRGLPAVFEGALPAIARIQLGPPALHALAPFAAMAVLMQQVEDTTTVHRAGLSGLARLRRDGADLQRSIERGEDPRPTLAHLNDIYRGIQLTMGGVADCLALALGIEMLFSAR